MSDLSQQIMEDLKTAMRAKDQLALGVLRGLKSSIKNAAIEKGGADAELDESETMAVIRKQVKQRQDSAEAFAKAERSDLEEKELAEIGILEKYLPAPLSGDELSALVDAAIEEAGATSKQEMGKVMGLLQGKVAGRADNKTLSQAVMGKLS